jgi:phospholipid/cholesterol/gamma-HCH transport system substrate-binding protein
VATRTQKMKVGVFLTSCITIMVCGFIILAGYYERPGIQYWIEFNESVLGLNEGAMVEYLGVPVGRVREIHVTPQKRAHVEISIDPYKVTLQSGVEAQLVLYSLAAGTMAVSLSGGDYHAPMLPANSQIPAKPSTIETISSQIEGLLGDLSGIAEKINHGFDGLETGDLKDIITQAGKLLDETTSLIDNGKTFVGQANETLTDLKGDAQKVIDEALGLSQDVRRLSGEVEDFIKIAKEKLVEFDVPQTQGQVNEVLERIVELSDNLNNTVKEFQDITANTLHEADNVEFSLRRSLAEINQVLESTRIFVEELRKDPSSLLRGKGQVKDSAP